MKRLSLFTLAVLLSSIFFSVFAGSVFADEQRIEVELEVTNATTLVGNTVGPYTILLFSGGNVNYDGIFDDLSIAETIQLANSIDNATVDTSAMSPAAQDAISRYVGYSQLPSIEFISFPIRTSKTSTGFITAPSEGVYTVVLPLLEANDLPGQKPLNITATSENTVVFSIDGPLIAPAPATARGELIGDLNCEGSSGAFGWILCPALSMFDSFTGFLYEGVQQELQVFTDDYGGENILVQDDSEDSLKPVWEGFRNLARGLLVLVFLVIVYAQLAGSTIVQAYNVKQMLPKLLIAVIAIELSWIIFKEFAFLVEDIGRGIPDLINIVFGNTIAEDGLVVEINSLGGGLSGVGLFLAIGSLIAGAAILLLPVALSVSLAILGAFIVLVLRRVVLYVLIIVSPLALVLWILPNTQETFKKWFQTYQNLLFMYLLIQVMVAMGAAMAAITSNIAGLEDIQGARELLMTVTAILLYFLPYMLIPFAFKWAGGLFANVAGMVNDRSRGLVDGYRKRTREKYEFGQARRQSTLGEGPESNSIEDRARYALQRKRAGFSYGKRRRGSLAEAQEYSSLSGARKTFTDLDTYHAAQEGVALSRDYDAARLAGNDRELDRIVQGSGYAAGRRFRSGNEFVGQIMQDRIAGTGSLTEKSAAISFLTQHQDGYKHMRGAQDSIFNDGDVGRRTRNIQAFTLAMQPSFGEVNGKAKDISTLDWNDGAGAEHARTKALISWMGEEEQKFASADKSTHIELADRIRGVDTRTGQAVASPADVGEVQDYAKALLSVFESNANIKKPIITEHVQAMRSRIDYIQPDTVERINEALRARGHHDASDLL